MEHAGSYGHYYINANYRGQEIRVITTDSEAWDWLDDDEAPINEVYSVKLEIIYDSLLSIMSDMGEMIGYTIFHDINEGVEEQS